MSDDNLPVRMTAILLGFLVMFVFFYIMPTFFGPTLAMNEHMLLPKMPHIGDDFRQFLSFADSWIKGTDHQFHRNNMYPPIFTLLFSPLTFLSFKTAYAIIAGIIFISYTFITLVFPYLVTKNKNYFPVIFLIYVMGLFTYPFQFALERGQVDVIAMAFCLLGVYLYHHRRRRFKYLAYALFCLAIQMKIYPAIMLGHLTPTTSVKNVKPAYPKTARDFGMQFASEQSCIEYLIQSRWTGCNPSTLQTTL